LWPPNSQAAEPADLTMPLIRLENVTKIYRTKGHSKVVLDHATVNIDATYAYGIFGPNGAGKSTTLRLIAGTELPNSGKIRKDLRVSWPLGFAGGFHPQMTGRENITFVARIYGADVRGVIEFVEYFSDLGHYLDLPVKTYSSGMQARLGFGLSMAIEFDCYLVDEITAVGDSRFQLRCAEAIADRKARSSLIMVSHDVGTIKKYCERGLVLHRGQFLHFSNVDDAVNFYRKMVGV
jgi:capsular polysaccharide transport system ATP-binding protein